METMAQAEALHRMLGDARKLAANGDPLLQGLYQALVARVEMLLSLVDVDAEKNA